MTTEVNNKEDKNVLSQETYGTINRYLTSNSISSFKNLLQTIKKSSSDRSEDNYLNYVLPTFNDDKFEMIYFIEENSTTQKYASGTAEYTTYCSFTKEVDEDFDEDNYDIESDYYHPDECDDQDVNYQDGTIDEVREELRLIPYPQYLSKMSKKVAA